ncbi:MAG: HNH endonuclease [Candidatus Riflebacteria bacterium]|nr:HNH endonuclease [Candidatus Riflebacteria bacterium]
MKHSERMNEISKAVGGRKPRNSHESVDELSRNQRRHVKKMLERLKKAIDADCDSGPGLLADKELRNFYREYNDRLVKHGPHSMPSSFNVLEAFFSYDSELNIFRMLEEKNHLFSFSDFMDFVTSENCADNYFESVFSIPDKIIFSYSSLDNPSDITFSYGGDIDFGFGAVSFVRHDDELTIIVVGGKSADIEAESEQLRGKCDVGDMLFRSLPGKKKLFPAPDTKLEATPLDADEKFWKILAITRINLTEQTEEVHYVLEDSGRFYNIVSDDPGIGENEDASREIEKIAKKRLPDFLPFFEVAKACVLLPQYFKFRYTLVRNESIPKNIANKRTEGISESDNDSTGSQSDERKIVYRNVAALRIVNPQVRSSVRRFTAPEYQVHVSGFWRNLPVGQVGHDMNGNPVPGKSWVRSHIRWKEGKEKPVSVLIKSRLSIAKRILDSEEAINSIDTNNNISIDSPVSDITISREEAFTQRKLLSSRLRWKIFQRDDFRCSICGVDAASDKSIRLDVDHIHPISRGGKTVPENLRTLCSSCNNGKGDLI